MNKLLVTLLIGGLCMTGHAQADSLATVGIVGKPGSDLERDLGIYRIGVKRLTLEALGQADLSALDGIFILADGYLDRKMTPLTPDQMKIFQGYLQSGGGVFIEFGQAPGLDVSDEIKGSDQILKVKIPGGRDRVWVTQPTHPITRGFEANDVLDDNMSFVAHAKVPAEAKVLLWHGPVGGTYKGFGMAAKKSLPGIVALEVGKGRLVWSALRVSNYRTYRFRLTSRWNRLLRNIVFHVLPDAQRAAVEAHFLPATAYTEPRRWVAPGDPVKAIVKTRPNATVKLTIAGRGPLPLKEIAPGQYEAALEGLLEGVHKLQFTLQHDKAKATKQVQLEVLDRQKKYRAAALANLEWLKRMLVTPDGIGGIEECIHGVLRPDGKPMMSGHKNRTDCTFESAWAFLAAGKYLKNPEVERIGLNMMDKRLLDPKVGFHDKDGIFNWFVGNKKAYPDDQGWNMMAFFGFYRLTGDEKYLHYAFNQLCRRPLGGSNRPHYNGPSNLAMVWAAALTDDPAFVKQRDKWVPVPQKIPETVKMGKPRVSLTTDTALWFWPYVEHVKYSRDKQRTLYARRMAQYLFDRQVACGALQEAGNFMSRNSVVGNDGPIFHGDDENINDNLYGSNYLAPALFEAWKATGDKVYHERFIRLMDFLVRIQLESETEPLLDGGWARGWDFEEWEIYGSNAAEFCRWAHFCMETGWTNAPLLLTLLHYLEDKSIFAEADEIDQAKARKVLEAVRAKIASKP